MRLAAVLTLAGIAAGGSGVAVGAGKSVKETTPSRAEMQVAADRVRSSAARLKAVARSAESQPESTKTAETLQRCIVELEASYEYLIGSFSRLISKDHAEQLNQMTQALDNLKKQKQSLTARITARSRSAVGWQQLTRELAGLGDRAVNSAALRIPPLITPTPTR